MEEQENITFVYCYIPDCPDRGRKFRNLGVHLKNKHKINSKEYKAITGGSVVTLETKRKISESHKGKSCPWMVGDNSPMRRPEVRKKNSESHKGVPRPYIMGENNSSKRPEVKAKISKATKGRKCPWMTGENSPAKRPEVRKKMSEHSGMKRPEVRAKRRETINKNKPWWFMGVGHDSNQESNIDRMRFELLGIVPIVGENIHIPVAGGEFDFEQLGFVHEHHPEIQIKKGYENTENYYKRRRALMDSNGHKTHELVVTISVKEAEKMYKWLNKHLYTTS